jgi:hypothetical protein
VSSGQGTGISEFRTPLLDIPVSCPGDRILLPVVDPIPPFPFPFAAGRAVSAHHRPRRAAGAFITVRRVSRSVCGDMHETRDALDCPARCGTMQGNRWMVPLLDGMSVPVRHSPKELPFR